MMISILLSSSVTAAPIPVEQFSASFLVTNYSMVYFYITLSGTVQDVSGTYKFVNYKPGVASYNGCYITPTSLSASLSNSNTICTVTVQGTYYGPNGYVLPNANASCKFYASQV